MSKYDNLTKEELLELIEKQNNELSSKKYGLVWDSEREPEQVVLDCQNNLPILKRIKGKEIRTNDSEDNILIEGDNYHALNVLNYTHQEKIDVIYIDPPYNTGNQDFKYNDRFVDKEDGFRHSKWLNFMEKRLNLAQKLLKETGVIFISIDDNEIAQLKMLCDKVLGEENFVGIISVQSTPGGRQSSKNLAVMGDYVVVYGKSQNSHIPGLPLSDKRIEQYNKQDKLGRYLTERLRQHGIAEKREDVPTLYFPIYYDEETKELSFKKSKGLIEILPILPTGEDGRWIWSKEKMIKDKDFIEIRKVKRNDEHIYEAFFKKYLVDSLKEKLPSIWIESDLRTEVGSKELREMFSGEKPFNFPKSRYFVKRLLQSCTNSNEIILDFMAGSGTTGHAVLELNKEDGGNRKFILCTNNELNGFEKELKKKGLSEKEIEKYGICQRVTYPRLQKVIEGYKKNGNGEKVEGLGGNLQYFRTDFVRKTKNRAQVRISLTGKCTEMLCVKENIFNLEFENDNYKIFSSNEKNKFLCVYYNFVEDGISEFVSKIKKIKGRKIIYMFSVDNEVDRSIFSGVEDFTLEAIPEGILKEYEKLNKMNISVDKDLIYFDFNKAKKVIFDESEKDDGAILLRIVLEKTIQKIAQKSGVGILKSDGRGEKASLMNDKLKGESIFSKVEWEENKTYLAIGNHAAHGEYSEYDIEQVKSFHRHIQSLLNKFEI